MDGYMYIYIYWNHSLWSLSPRNIWARSKPIRCNSEMGSVPGPVQPCNCSDKCRNPQPRRIPLLHAANIHADRRDPLRVRNRPLIHKFLGIHSRKNLCCPPPLFRKSPRNLETFRKCRQILDCKDPKGFVLGLDCTILDRSRLTARD